MSGIAKEDIFHQIPREERLPNGGEATLVIDEDLPTLKREQLLRKHGKIHSLTHSAGPRN